FYMSPPPPRSPPFPYTTLFRSKISDNSQNLKRFLYGQRGESFTNRRSVFDPHEYILDALPKIKLYGKEMKSYEKEGDLERVVYRSEEHTSELQSRENLVCRLLL